MKDRQLQQGDSNIIHTLLRKDSSNQTEILTQEVSPKTHHYKYYAEDSHSRKAKYYLSSSDSSISASESADVIVTSGLS